MSPVVQLVFAALLIVAAIALAKGAGKRLEKKVKEKEEKKEQEKKEKKPPKWQRTLGEGTFLVRRSWSGSCCRFPASPTSPL